jgi:hypothetical protein
MVANILTGLARSTKRHWGDAISTARLYYNYLRLSPSYAAGCLHGLRSTGSKLNRHGAKVLACVNKYRDVHKTSFEDWVAGAGSVRVHAPSHMPEIVTAQALVVRHQSDLFIRFPYGQNAMPQLELLTMIATTVPSSVRERPSRQSLTSLRLTPVVQKNLWRDVYLAYLIKNYPEAELWRLGAEAMLVDRFIGKIEPTGRRMNSSQDHERRLLVAMVVRHRAWAANISEYAAIDEFPCKEALPNGQRCLELQAVDLLPHLTCHSLEESMNARLQVIRCTGTVGIVSVEPSFKHQGMLF